MEMPSFTAVVSLYSFTLVRLLRDMLLLSSLHTLHAYMPTYLPIYLRTRHAISHISYQAYVNPRNVFDSYSRTTTKHRSFFASRRDRQALPQSYKRRGPESDRSSPPSKRCQLCRIDETRNHDEKKTERYHGVLKMSTELRFILILS